MLNTVKNMKNNLYNFKFPELKYNKINSNEFIFNNNISNSSKEEIYPNLYNINNSNEFIDIIENKSLKNEIYEDSIKNEINKNFLINIQFFENEVYNEWQNSLNKLNNILSISSDFLFKEDNIIEKNNFSFQKMPKLAEKEKTLGLNNKSTFNA